MLRMPSHDMRARHAAAIGHEVTRHRARALDEQVTPCRQVKLRRLEVRCQLNRAIAVGLMRRVRSRRARYNRSLIETDAASVDRHVLGRWHED